MKKLLTMVCAWALLGSCVQDVPEGEVLINLAELDETGRQFIEMLQKRPDWQTEWAEMNEHGQPLPNEMINVISSRGAYFVVPIAEKENVRKVKAIVFCPSGFGEMHHDKSSSRTTSVDGTELADPKLEIVQLSNVDDHLIAKMFVLSGTHKKWSEKGYSVEARATPMTTTVKRVRGAGSSTRSSVERHMQGASYDFEWSFDYERPLFNSEYAELVLYIGQCLHNAAEKETLMRYYYSPSWLPWDFRSGHGYSGYGDHPSAEYCTMEPPIFWVRGTNLFTTDPLFGPPDPNMGTDAIWNAFQYGFEHSVLSIQGVVFGGIWCTSHYYEDLGDYSYNIGTGTGLLIRDPDGTNPNSNFQNEKPTQAEVDCAGVSNEKANASYVYSDFERLQEVKYVPTGSDTVTFAGFQDFRDAVNADPLTEHSLTLTAPSWATAENGLGVNGGFLGHSDGVANGVMNSVVIREDPNVWASIHNHPKSGDPTPSALDLIHTVYMAAKYPGYQGAYIWADSDGNGVYYNDDIYFVCVTMSAAQRTALLAQGAVSNFDAFKNSIVDAGNNFKRGTKYYEDYRTAISHFSKLDKNNGTCHALSVIAEQNGWGVTVMRKKSSELSFTSKRARKDYAGNYVPTEC